MKYIPILLLLLISVSFYSCKKSEVNPVNNYEMKFKKDGENVTLLPYYCAIQPSIATPSQTEFFLTASSIDNRVHFGIVIQVKGDFVPGTYETTITGTHYVGADYLIDTNHPTERYYTVDTAPNKPKARFSVTITSIEEKVVKGTFTGNYLYDISAKESIVINNGSFVAKRHK